MASGSRGPGGTELSARERALQLATELFRRKHGDKAAAEFAAKFEQDSPPPAPPEPQPRPAVQAEPPDAVQGEGQGAQAEPGPAGSSPASEPARAAPRRNPRHLGSQAPAERASRQQRRLLRNIKRKDLGAQARDRRLRGDDDPGGTGLSTGDYRKVRAAVNDASGRAAGCLVYQLPVFQGYQLVTAGRTPRTAIGRRSIAYTFLVQAVGRGFQVRGKKREWFTALLADPHNDRLLLENDCRPSVRTFSTLATALDSAGSGRWHVPEGLCVVRRWQVPDEMAAAEEWLPGARRPTSRYQLAPTPIDFDTGRAFAVIAALMGDALPQTRAAQDDPEQDEQGERAPAAADGAALGATGGTGPPASA